MEVVEHDSCGSLARGKRNGQLVFVCDDEHSPSKEWGSYRSGSLISSQSIHERLTKSRIARSASRPILAEVTEANGADRQAVCAHYDCMIIRNHWTEDTPPERHYRIWVFKEDDRASIWLQQGYFGRLELLRELSATFTIALSHAIRESRLFEWDRTYENKRDQGWTIGGNAWSIALIAGDLKVSTEGLDASPPMLEGLCRNLRKLGVPVRLRKNRGLEYAPTRKK